MNNYLIDYINKYTSLISHIDSKKVDALTKIFKNIKNKKSKIIIVGNGGSASIASHVSTDLSKVCKVRSLNFNEGNFLTCLSNDFGYENWVVEALKMHSDKTDLIILISSSGTSPNIINAAKYLKKNKIKLVTLNGFDKKKPPLKKFGDLNFSIDSSNYNMIENIHQFILLSALDCLIKTKV